MNLVDLSDLMRERSDHDPVPVLTQDRLDGVHHKVVVARRRRVAGVLVALALVVVAVVNVGIPHGRDSAPATIGGFPAYADGGHVVATATGDLRGGAVSVTVVPERLDFIYTNVCSAASTTMMIMIDVTVNGHSISSFSCAEDVGGTYASADPALWSTIGLAVGQPATFTFTPASAEVITSDVDGKQTSATVAMPSGMFSIAVLQKLPFDQYPLPPRPKKLPALDVRGMSLSDDPAPIIVNSDPGDPLQPQTYTFTFPDCSRAPDDICLEAALTSQTPGFLKVTVNGVSVTTGEFWDYSAGGSSFEFGTTMDQIKLHTGETVTVTITPQYVTGAWQFGMSSKPLTNR